MLWGILYNAYNNAYLSALPLNSVLAGQSKCSKENKILQSNHIWGTALQLFLV